MADKDIGARVDRRAREGAREIGGLLQFGLVLRREQARLAVFVAVQVEHDPIGLPSRLPDPAQVVLDVGLRRLRSSP